MYVLLNVSTRSTPQKNTESTLLPQNTLRPHGRRPEETPLETSAMGQAARRLQLLCNGRRGADARTSSAQVFRRKARHYPRVQKMQPRPVQQRSVPPVSEIHCRSPRRVETRQKRRRTHGCQKICKILTRCFNGKCNVKVPRETVCRRNDPPAHTPRGPRRPHGASGYPPPQNACPRAGPSCGRECCACTSPPA